MREHIDIILPTVNFDAKILPRGNPKTVEGRSIGKGSIKTHVKTSSKKVKPLTTPGDLSNCDTQITPDCLRALYNFTSFTPKAMSKNSYGIGESYVRGSTGFPNELPVEFTPQGKAEFLNETFLLFNIFEAFLQNDLNMFFKNFSPSLVGTTPTLVSIDGGMWRLWYNFLH